jgi:hypothetical protein
MNNLLRIIFAGVVLMFSANASAVMLSFGCITNNSMTNCAAGESQTSLEVTDVMNDQVLFKFTNSGPNASFISDIYFDNDNGTGVGSTLASIASLDESTGVDFDFPINGNGDLPGGNTVNFNTTGTGAMALEAQNEPGAINGINNNGEMLGILFNLQMGQDFSDVVSELASGDLRVGIHVQGFSGGGSESFVNAPVPVPAAVWLMCTGLIGLIGFGRKRQNM